MCRQPARFRSAGVALAGTRTLDPWMVTSTGASALGARISAGVAGAPAESSSVLTGVTGGENFTSMRMMAAIGVPPRCAGSKRHELAARMAEPTNGSSPAVG